MTDIDAQRYRDRQPCAEQERRQALAMNYFEPSWWRRLLRRAANSLWRISDGFRLPVTGGLAKYPGFASGMDHPASTVTVSCDPLDDSDCNWGDDNQSAEWVVLRAWTVQRSELRIQDAQRMN